MRSFLDTLTNSVNYISTIGVADAFDILIVAFIVFEFIRLIWKTKTMRLARGVVILLLVLWLSGILQLTMINFILRKAVELGVVALVILFQPELRRLLEKVGNSSRISALLGLGNGMQSKHMEGAISQTAAACADMGAVKTGALIVFVRDNHLADPISTGTIVDASVTSELLKNLFFKNSPLHDGAVIIRDGRIAAAGCILPVSKNMKISKELGTRHRAGIGISEQSDAVVVIVSEETGSISLAIDGKLERHLNAKTLEKRLREELVHEEPIQPADRKNVLDIIKGRKNGNG